jgi:rubrerythrin
MERTMKNLTLRKAIEMAVATEELGAKYYQEIANKFSNESEIARVFKQLAEGTGSPTRLSSRGY